MSHSDSTPAAAFSPVVPTAPASSPESAQNPQHAVALPATDKHMSSFERFQKRLQAADEEKKKALGAIDSTQETDGKEAADLPPPPPSLAKYHAVEYSHSGQMTSPSSAHVSAAAQDQHLRDAPKQQESHAMGVSRPSFQWNVAEAGEAQNTTPSPSRPRSDSYALRYSPPNVSAVSSSFASPATPAFSRPRHPRSMSPASSNKTLSVPMAEENVASKEVGEEAHKEYDPYRGNTYSGQLLPTADYDSISPPKFSLAGEDCAGDDASGSKMTMVNAANKQEQSGGAIDDDGQEYSEIEGAEATHGHESPLSSSTIGARSGDRVSETFDFDHDDAQDVMNISRTDDNGFVVPHVDGIVSVDPEQLDSLLESRSKDSPESSLTFLPTSPTPAVHRRASSSTGRVISAFSSPSVTRTPSSPHVQFALNLPIHDTSYTKTLAYFKQFKNKENSPSKNSPHKSRRNAALPEEIAKMAKEAQQDGVEEGAEWDRYREIDLAPMDPILEDGLAGDLIIAGTPMKNDPFGVVGESPSSRKSDEDPLEEQGVVVEESAVETLTREGVGASMGHDGSYLLGKPREESLSTKAIVGHGTLKTRTPTKKGIGAWADEIWSPEKFVVWQGVDVDTDGEGSKYELNIPGHYGDSFKMRIRTSCGASEIASFMRERGQALDASKEAIDQAVSEFLACPESFIIADDDAKTARSEEDEDDKVHEKQMILYQEDPVFVKVIGMLPQAMFWAVTQPIVHYSTKAFDTVLQKFTGLSLE